MFRFYTSKRGGYFSPHALLDQQTIGNIITQRDIVDGFCSIQTYNLDMIETGSQLVFDIDVKDDISYAMDIARYITKQVKERYDAHTTLWFSGSKGFHVVTGLHYRHRLANRAMKAVATSISNEVDVSMYKTRSMFRLPNTINSKSGLYKIMVSENDSIAKILNLAKFKGFIDKAIPSDSQLFNKQIEASIKELEQIPVSTVTITKSDIHWSETLPPCITEMLYNGVPNGYRWHFCFWLVRHLRLQGLDVDEAIAVANDIPVFSEAGYTDSMVRHYYRQEPLSIGCVHGPLAGEQQARCNGSCPMSDEYAMETDKLTRNFYELTR